jgi:hypothetical protein
MVTGSIMADVLTWERAFLRRGMTSLGLISGISEIVHTQVTGTAGSLNLGKLLLKIISTFSIVLITK